MKAKAASIYPAGVPSYLERENQLGGVEANDSLGEALVTTQVEE